MRTNASRHQERGGTTEQLTTDVDAGDRQRVPVAGGVLVYETRGLGKELVGFREVSDYDDLADALAARGHDRGAIYHLPELEDLERGA